MEIAIRPWTLEDIPALAAIANNYKIWKQVRDRLPHPYGLKDAEEWVRFSAGANPITDFAITADSLPAGAIGFMLHEDIYRKSIQIGYYVGESFWGKGIATAAVKQLLDKLQKEYDVVRFYSGVFENNPASMRVLEKNGFHLECIHKKTIFKDNVLMDEHLWVKLI